MYQQLMVGEVARGLSLFGGACSEVRRCNCSVVVYMRASFLPEIYVSLYLYLIPPTARRGLDRARAGTEPVIMALFIFAVATAALRMHAFALGALERPPLPRGMAASMLEQGPERPTAALVPPPRRLTDLLELEAKGVPQKQGSLFTGRTRRVVRRGMNACASNSGPQTSDW